MDLFDPDPRNINRQRYCSNADCQIASKAASQAAWLAKPQNSDYFRDPVHVTRVQVEAKLKAEGEYEVFRQRQDADFISDFDREIKRIESKKI